MSEHTVTHDNHGHDTHEEIVSTPDFSQHAQEHSETHSSISLSKFAKALIMSWKESGRSSPLSPNKISVSQTVSFLAFLYEKMRNAVEFREDHLIRKAAIERILKRRMILNENGRDIAELLIKELLWARYYENNTLSEDKIYEVQAIIDKYFFIRNEISAGRGNKESEAINEFIVDVLSCEIEEVLSPSNKREAFINFVYQLLRNHVAPDKGGTIERDILVYIAVERSFAHSDDAIIRYHLLKLMIPQIKESNWKTADKFLPQFYDVYRDIEKAIKHPLSDKIKNFVKKQKPPFLILQDIFQQNPRDIENILTDEGKLKAKVDQACRKRYDETKDRLRRTGVRSFIYIVLTKVVFAFIIEIPYDLYIQKAISYLPITINVIFPPLLMSGIILSVTVPGDDNTRKIFNLIKSILVEEPGDPEHLKSAVRFGVRPKSRGIIFTSLFSILYLATYLVTFGLIIYILSQLHFNVVSQVIFIFFITLVTFFAFRVIGITQEYLVIDRDNILTPVFDFFFIPILWVGRWLSGEVLTRFNVLIFLFDFIIEMPLKAVVEVIDEWVHFVKLKKEEIV